MNRLMPAFRVARVRLLPCPSFDDAPCLVHLYMDGSRTTQTLPATFGFPDAMWEARKLIRDEVQIWSRLFLPVLVREFVDHRGQHLDCDPCKPYVLSLPLAFGYEMVEPHLVRNVHEGGDITLARRGERIDTTYEVKLEDPGPAVEPELYETLAAECADFDAMDHVPPFNPRRYEKTAKRVFEAYR